MGKKKDTSVLVSAMGALTGIITALIAAVKKKGGTEEDFYRLVRPEGESLIEKIADLIVQAGRRVEEVKPLFLRLLSSGGEKIILDSCDGTDIIPGSNDMFNAGIDPDFVNWKANEKGQATNETEVSVYETTKDATFANMFGSLGNIPDLCFTQAQIKSFIKKHRHWLRNDGYATFFLFKSHNQFFVAYVDMYSGGALHVSVYRFEHSRVWFAVRRTRVVVPKLA